MDQQLKEYYDRFIIHLGLMNLGDRTIDIYCSIAKQFFYSINDSPLNISQEWLEIFVYKKNASRSKEQALTVLKHLYRNIFNQPEKVNNIPLPKREEYLPDILTTDEVYRIVNHPSFIKQRAALTFIYTGALRISECVNAKFHHVDAFSHQFKIKSGKGRKDRVVFIPQETLNLLENYYSECMPQNRGQYIFDGQKIGEHYSTRSIQIVFNLAVSELNILKDVSVHTLRHSRCVHWLDNGIDIRKIQLACGHKRLSTTEHYTQLSIQNYRNVFESADDKIKLEVLAMQAIQKQISCMK